MHSSNPALRTFHHPQSWAQLGAASTARTMTMQGTIMASAVMLAACACSAVGAWGLISAGTVPILPVTAGGAIGGLVLGLILFFSPRMAPILGIPYAICEGAFVGGVSMIYAAWVAEIEGNSAASLESLASAGSFIVAQAVLLTFGIFAAMLIAYSTRMIRATPAMIKGIFAATVAVGVLMLGTWLLRFFMPIPYLWDMGALGVGIAAVIVVVAAFNLIIDFHVIETGVRGQAPKYMEWYAGYALLVTLVWLYLSILRLLAMLRRE